MKRWNGWGAEGVQYHFPDSAARFLQDALGTGSTRHDAALEDVLRTVPPSRLMESAIYIREPFARLVHARGQSLPDWVALHSGEIGAFPDAVAYPRSDAEVRAVLEYAEDANVSLIPYGGGTSVVGHINPIKGGRPVLTVDLSRMSGLLSLDAVSHLATFGAGTPGPAVEANLNPLGFTLGHYPQSFDYSTVGGWVASRSSGQQSLCYGRIEDLFVGGHIETPVGPVDMSPVPATAAGPDLRQAFLGSEGRLGILTRATLRIRPLPENEEFFGAFFPSWEAGVHAVRTLAREELHLSMLRFSDPEETETTLVLSGRDRMVTTAKIGLGLMGFSSQRCLLVYGVTGEREDTERSSRRTDQIIRQHGGLPAGALIGRLWRKSRFRTPYLRNTLWERGYALDTLETAVPWSSVEGAARAIKDALAKALDEQNLRGLVFSHLSHVYRDGASIYVTYLFPRSSAPEEIVEKWWTLKSAATRTIQEWGGTVSHQHGVGMDHASFLQYEKGGVGVRWLEGLLGSADPNGIMNPGKLLFSNDFHPYGDRDVEQRMA